MKRPIALLLLVVAAGSCGDPREEPPSTTIPEIAPRTADARSTSSRVPFEERLHYVRIPRLGGEVGAGTHVDLLAVFTTTSDAVAMTLLQNIAVIDVRKAGPDADDLGVSLTPNEALTLEITAARGTIWPLVRNPEDAEVHTVGRATLESSLGQLDAIQHARNRRGHPSKRPAGTLLTSIRTDERAMLMPHGLPTGVLAAGDHVDLHGVFGPTETGIQLLQDVQVLGVYGDQVALSVTPDEADLLALAATEGTVTVLLRNADDVEISTLKKQTLREVLADLQIIQEKRQIRIRRAPKKMKSMAHGASIEIISAGSGGIEPRSTGESYTNYGTNPFTLTTKDRFSTFAADVDTGSYTIARRKLLEGALPVADGVRVEEFLNYFTYDYPEPESGAFRVSMEAAPSPFQTSSDYRLLRVGLQARTIEAGQRKPIHLTFLVDVSGSMNSPDKLPLVQTSLRHLVGALRPQDTVAIATYAGRTEVLLEPATVDQRGAIFDAIERLVSGGGTAMNDGLRTAYDLADATFATGEENRVLVLSDGDANVGATSVDEMLATIATGAKRGITLSTVGFGGGNYNDSAMEQLADKGNGNYFYVDSESEARRVFGDQLDGTLQTIARDVKIQVEFNPTVVKRYRLVGYENRDIADADFRKDEVDAGEIGAGHTVTALYELELTGKSADAVATVRVRHKPPQGSDRATEEAFTLHASEVASRLADTSDSFRFAAAVAAFAEILRGSPYAAPLNLDWVLEIARGAAGTYGDRAELVGLVETAKRLRP